MATLTSLKGVVPLQHSRMSSQESCRGQAAALIWLFGCAWTAQLVTQNQGTCVLSLITLRLPFTNKNPGV